MTGLEGMDFDAEDGVDLPACAAALAPDRVEDCVAALVVDVADDFPAAELSLLEAAVCCACAVPGLPDDAVADPETAVEPGFLAPVASLDEVEVAAGFAVDFSASRSMVIGLRVVRE
ncbi:MAG: hypothetical protein AAFU56_00290 [Pseudomonadota bacterium]